MRIEYLKTVGSTNSYLRQYLESGEERIVCAERQTEGRGTKGRSFLSERGGVYLSALSFPALPVGEAFGIMTHAAVAVCRTAEEFALAPEIKWCNDVLVEGRKLAGILIENTLSGDVVKASIVGIGLNVSNSLNGLEGIAVNMAELSKTPPAVEDVRAALISNYLKPSSFSDYLHYVRFLGREVRVVEGEREYVAVAEEILPDGRLRIKEGSVSRALSAAEIKLRLSEEV